MNTQQYTSSGEQNQSDHENGLVDSQPELPSQQMGFLRRALGNVQNDEAPTTNANRYDSFDEYCVRFLALEELVLVKAMNDEKTRQQKSRIIFFLMFPLLLAAQFGLTLVAIRFFQLPIISQEGGVVVNQSMTDTENNVMYDMYQDDHQQHSNMNIDGIGIERNLNGDMGSMGGMGGDSNGFCTSPGMVMLMDGFQFVLKGKSSCINLFFQSWTLDKAWKVVVAMIGVILLSISAEAMLKYRQKLGATTAK